jgi:hypothetical protein
MFSIACANIAKRITEKKETPSMWRQEPHRVELKQ